MTMNPRDVTDPTAVTRAIHEFDSIGRDAFLERHGFGKARDYCIAYNGKRDDSKAILGVTHAHHHGEPLRRRSFNGGRKTTEPLEAMGFEITS